jgi:two-component system phosphate regulon sensor histidine kinase PhoR
MAEAVVAVDNKSRVLAVNPALVSLFKVELPAEGKFLLEILRHHPIQEIVSSVLERGAPRAEEVALFAPLELIFEVHAAPLLEEGRPIGALAVLHDITRLRKLENIRREFVANVSHELRTPVSAIKGFAETLREGALEDPKHRLEFVRSIEEYADRLAGLVDGLLELSAIESGQRGPKKEPVSLLAIARDCARELKPLAERRKVRFEIPSAQDASVAADPGQMRRVFMNLLGNAVKFNKEGGWVRVRRQDAQGKAVFFVEDSGVGIDARDLPRVIERFFRADKSRSSETGGTGLGLSIVKHIVEAHGGAVGVESRLGEGSVFHFSVPL